MPKAGGKIIQLRPSPGPTFQIRSENLSARCDICHQTDCFDPINNYCSRCSDIAPIMLTQQFDAIAAPEILINDANDPHDNQFVSVGAVTGTSIGLVFALLFCLLPMAQNPATILFDPEFYIFFSALTFTGLISGLINALFLKDIPNQSLNNFTAKFFCWLVSVILSACTSGIALVFLTSIAVIFTPQVDDMAWGLGMICGLVGGINGMFNSIVLISRKITRQQLTFEDPNLL